MKQIQQHIWRLCAGIGLLAIVQFFSACQAGAPGTAKALPAASSPLSAAMVAEAEPQQDSRALIVAFGDSLTAGYGLSKAQNYTTLLQQKLDAGGWPYRVVNAGVSGDTTAGGARRIAWALEGNVKYMILELGGNDALRGLPINEMRKNLTHIIETARQRDVKILLAGMEAPPNLGMAYTTSFRQVFYDLAKQYKLPFVPFVLEGIGGRPEFNQSDGIHPNAEGEKRMTENVWRVLQPLLVK